MVEEDQKVMSAIARSEAREAREAQQTCASTGRSDAISIILLRRSKFWWSTSSVLLQKAASMMKRKRSALEKVDADLPNLQHKIRSDPASYQNEFNSQYEQYSSLHELFLQSPTTTDDNGLVRLRDLIDFVGHVADCYPDTTSGFAQDLIGLLERHHETLESELRDKIVGSLVLLRKKKIVDSAKLLNTLWPVLISTRSKTLRTLLFQKIVSDLRTSHSSKLNSSMQATCRNLIDSDPASPKGLWAVKLTRALWKKQTWSHEKAASEKAVGIMEAAALNQDAKVVIGGVRFFLGADQEDAEEEESDDDEDNIDMGKLRHQTGINKKTVKTDRALKTAAAKVKRKQRKKKVIHSTHFSALYLPNDPQTFAENLFQRHIQPTQPKVRLNLEQKLLVLQLVSRLVGLHQLTLLPLYSYFIKYLTPRQPNVTSFLASLAQSTHKYVPPDVLEPLVQKIANEFVSEAAAAEVASAGLNGIREICVRQPEAMNETLLQDLVQYRKSKDKGVQMAARGLLSHYREYGAGMLKKRDRGRDAALKLRAGDMDQHARFGFVQTGEIEGLELLEKWKKEQGVDGEEDEAKGWEKWDAESDDSDSSGGWIAVESDGEEIDVSDSEDEKDKAKAKKNAGADRSKDYDKENGGEEPSVEQEDVNKLASSDAEALVLAEEIPASNWATTHLLNPADLAKLRELRTAAAVTSNMPSAKRRKLQQAAQTSQRHVDDAVTSADIEGLASLSRKFTKDEKIKMAKGERPDGKTEDNDHRSTTARRKEKKASEGKSTTNKEKARKKNFMMTLGKAKKKGKRSLQEHRKVLKAHVDRGKKGGRRGNK